MNNKRIPIFIIGQLPPPMHGSNVMAKITRDILIESGYDVCFIDKKFSKTLSQIGKITIQKLLRYPSLSLEIFAKSFQKKPILCIYFIAVGKPAFLLDCFYLFLLRATRVPYVLRFDGKGYSLLQKESHFWNKLVKNALSNALGGFILGSKLKYDINSNITNNRLKILPNCVPDPKIVPPQVIDNKIRVLFLSNLLPTKGVMEVLNAAKIVLMKKQIFFTLAGTIDSKTFKEKIKKFIKDNKIGKYVSLPGPVYGAEKASLFNNSDIFLFPTYYEHETFAIVNVEAMSYGIPVISSDEGVITEIVKDGINGFIVNPKSPEEIAEKVLILAENPSLRQNMGDRGKEIYKNRFTREAHANSLDTALRFFFTFSVERKIN